MSAPALSRMDFMGKCVDKCLKGPEWISQIDPQQGRILCLQYHVPRWAKEFKYDLDIDEKFYGELADRLIQDALEDDVKESDGSDGHSDEESDGSVDEKVKEQLALIDQCVEEVTLLLAKKEEPPFDIPDDLEAYPWVFQGKAVFAMANGWLWERLDDEKFGPFLGKYNPASGLLDTTAAEPDEYDE